MTRFESKRRLVRPPAECQVKPHTSSFCAAVRETRKGDKLVLDLRCDALKNLSSKLDGIHEVYLADFPPPQVSEPEKLVDVPATPSTPIASPVTVTTTISSANEYQQQLAEWCETRSVEENNHIRAFMGGRIKDLVRTGLT